MSKLISAAADSLTSVYRERYGRWLRGATAITVRPAVKKEDFIVKSNTFETKPFKLHKLEKGPATTVSISAKECLQLYTLMAVARRLETVTANLYKQKSIRGFCHLYAGQEAVAVGMKSVFRPMDTVVTAYRCHAWTYLMGISAEGVLSELVGRRTGCSKGKGGSMHMYGPNFYGGNGIVGASSPLGAGLAFAHKYKKDGGVCFTLFGEGAANQGQTFESFNIAKLWNLPVVFVCENNGYGLGTSAARSSASTDFYTRGDYIPGIWVNGMDVLATREATKFAIDYCMKDKGPILLEMSTYRYYGHSMSDPGTSYRTREEVQEVRKTRDPIMTFKERLVEAKIATERELKAIDARVKKEVDAATKKSLAEKELPPSDVCADVYYKNLHSEIRGVHPGAPMKHVESAPRTMK